MTEKHDFFQKPVFPIFRQVCYNVNVPQCSVSPCQTGTCNQQPGLSVCSQNQFNTNTVCPTGGIPGVPRETSYLHALGLD